MALSELAAIEAAYHALLDLDEAARRRALRWLSDALNAGLPVDESSTQAEPTVTQDRAEPTAATTVRRGSGPTGRRGPSAGRKRTRAVVSDPRASTGQRGRRRRETTPPSAERAYRRMPPADEVMAAYQQVGTVSGLAEHYNVPGHTVQGWARRLREQGYQIGRQA